MTSESFAFRSGRIYLRLIEIKTQNLDVLKDLVDPEGV